MNDSDLLQSFPLPPSHIPYPNPPPSRPPSLPLPPLPGPSRINEHGTLLLLSSANHRHSSRYSDTNSISSIDINDIKDDEDIVPPFTPFPRASSPDINSIISATPRIRKQSSSGFSDARSRKSSIVSSDLLEGDLKYIHGTWDPVDNDDDDDLLHLNQPDDGEDTDSSIDLHTPLPHLMVKHGLLSPHSKLLPQPNKPLADKRPQRSPSIPHTKDSRDTPMRKERHRDGRLLRGGIGLTTGLGWSDSEDENAPSPLTRRLSTLNLSRRSSAPSSNITTTRSLSIASSSSKYRPHPLARSFSGGAVYPDPLEDEDEDEGVNEWGVRRTLPPENKPPTSWNARKTTTGVGRRYGSVAIIDSSSTGVGTRISTSSLNSNSSSSNGNGNFGMRNVKSKTTLLGSNTTMIIETSPSSGSGSGSDTTSTLSVPPTPLDELSLSTFGAMKKVDKEKSLPPLPTQQQQHHQSQQHPVGILKKTTFPTSGTRVRTRTISNCTTSPTSPTPPTSVPAQLLSSSTSTYPSTYTSTSTSTSIYTSTSTYTSNSTSLVRPLQLPQRMASLRSSSFSSSSGPGPSSGFSSSVGSGSGVPVLRGSVSQSIIGSGGGNQVYNRSLNLSKSISGLPGPGRKNVNHLSSLSTPNSPIGPSHYSNSVSSPYSNSNSGSTSMSASVSASASIKKKPRTGTGMVYRKSGAGSGNGSGIARSISSASTSMNGRLMKSPVPVPVPSVRSRVGSATSMGMNRSTELERIGVNVSEDGRNFSGSGHIIGQAF